MRDELLAEPKDIISIQLLLPKANGGNPELLKKWAEMQAKEYILRVLDSPYTSYCQYWLFQAVKKYGIDNTLIDKIFVNRNQMASGPDLYSITTGALAIQESLQLEEMRNRTTIPDDRSIPLSTLQGPQIKSHPFKEMLQNKEPHS